MGRPYKFGRLWIPTGVYNNGHETPRLVLATLSDYFGDRRIPKLGNSTNSLFRLLGSDSLKKAKDKKSSKD
jgi:hypothetical protein